MATDAGRSHPTRRVAGAGRRHRLRARHLHRSVRPRPRRKRRSCATGCCAPASSATRLRCTRASCREPSRRRRRSRRPSATASWRSQHCDWCEQHPGEGEGLAVRRVRRALRRLQRGRRPRAGAGAGIRERRHVRATGSRRRWCAWSTSTTARSIVIVCHGGVDRLRARGARRHPVRLTRSLRRQHLDHRAASATTTTTGGSSASTTPPTWPETLRVA